MGFFGKKKEKEANPQPEYILMSDGKVCQPTAPPAGFSTSINAGAPQPPDGLLFGSAEPLYDVEQTAQNGMLFAVQQPYAEVPSDAADLLFGAPQEQPLFFEQEPTEPMVNLFAPQEDLPAVDSPDFAGGMEPFFAAGDAAQVTAQDTADFSGFFDLDMTDLSAASNTAGVAAETTDTDFGSFFRLDTTDMEASSAEAASAEQSMSDFFSVGIEPIAEAPAEPEQSAEPVEDNPFAGFFDAEPIAEAPAEPEPSVEPAAEPVEDNPFAGFFDAEPIAEAPIELEQSTEPAAEPIEDNPFAGFFDAEPIADAPAEPEQSAEQIAEPLETADSDVDDIFASFFGES